MLSKLWANIYWTMWFFWNNPFGSRERIARLSIAETPREMDEFDEAEALSFQDGLDVPQEASGDVLVNNGPALEACFQKLAHEWEA